VVRRSARLLHSVPRDSNVRNLGSGMGILRRAEEWKLSGDRWGSTEERDNGTGGRSAHSALRSRKHDGCRRRRYGEWDAPREHDLLGALLWRIGEEAQTSPGYPTSANPGRKVGRRLGRDESPRRASTGAHRERSGHRVTTGRCRETACDMEVLTRGNRNEEGGSLSIG